MNVFLRTGRQGRTERVRGWGPWSGGRSSNSHHRTLFPNHHACFEISSFFLSAQTASAEPHTSLARRPRAPQCPQSGAKTGLGTGTLKGSLTNVTEEVWPSRAVSGEKDHGGQDSGSTQAPGGR